MALSAYTFAVSISELQLKGLNVHECEVFVLPFSVLSLCGGQGQGSRTKISRERALGGTVVPISSVCSATGRGGDTYHTAALNESGDRPHSCCPSQVYQEKEILVYCLSVQRYTV